MDKITFSFLQLPTATGKMFALNANLPVTHLPFCPFVTTSCAKGQATILPEGVLTFSKIILRMRNYTLIEPEIYSTLNWNLDLIVKCLEVIRSQMPQIISEDSATIEYGLLVVHNPHRPAYPGIGMYCPEKAIFDQEGYNSFEINTKVNDWVQKTGITPILAKACEIEYIDWQQLTRLQTYPAWAKAE